MVHFFKKCQVYNIIHRIENETMLLYDKTLQLCNTVMFLTIFYYISLWSLEELRYYLETRGSYPHRRVKSRIRS